MPGKIWLKCKFLIKIHTNCWKLLSKIKTLKNILKIEVFMLEIYTNKDQLMTF